MKSSLIALAASSLLGSAAASLHQRHMDFHLKRDNIFLERGASESETCGCEVFTTTVYGAMTLVPNPPPAPTPIVSTYATPGTYTIISSTITLTETTTVASASIATLTPGEGTYGGVTTTVSGPTTVTVPIGTVSGSGSATTSVVSTTTHVCSSSGACVIGATATSVSTSTISVYPVPATYSPGTYTVPQSTITVTTTDYVYVCPFSSVTSTSAPASSTPVAPVSTSEAPAPVKPAEYSSPVSPVETSEAPSAAKPTGEGYIGGHKGGNNGGHKGGSSGGIGANGNKWAMSYTPYTSSGTCKTADEVSSDIAQIAGKGFTTVRLYATDCSGLQNVGGAAKNHGMKIIAGIFIDESGIGGAADQVTQIISWGSSGNWDTVELVVVGNEAIFNEYCSATALAAFISSSKALLVAAGYNGPVTTTEPLGTLMANKGALCGSIDVVAANIQPFFNADVSAGGAGSFVASQLQLTGEQCPGKTAYNLECGWPSGGSPNGAAVPGVSEQQEAIGGILSSSAASKTVIFSFQNDDWKAPGPYGVETQFGCADIIS